MIEQINEQTTYTTVARLTEAAGRAQTLGRFEGN